MKIPSIRTLWLALALSGCVHLQSVSTTSLPVERSKPVEVKAQKFLFLLINMNNKYVDQLVEDLARQCPHGSVEGILTKQEAIMYFPLIAHASRVTATGYCVEPQGAE